MLPDFPRSLFDISGLMSLEAMLRETEPDVTECLQWGRDRYALPLSFLQGRVAVPSSSD